jgi:hypothetical protein
LYKRTEVRRADKSILDDLEFTSTAGRTGDAQQVLGQVVDTLAPLIRITTHLRERLDGYVGQQSRCGRYTELYPSEHLHLLHLTLWLSGARSTVVEIGFNGDGELCKISLVTTLPSKRTLFLCLGMDGGVKTVYVTPQYKYRNTYRGAVPQFADAGEMCAWLRWEI